MNGKQQTAHGLNHGEIRIWRQPCHISLWSLREVSKVRQSNFERLNTRGVLLQGLHRSLELLWRVKWVEEGNVSGPDVNVMCVESSANLLDLLRDVSRGSDHHCRVMADLSR